MSGRQPNLADFLQPQLGCATPQRNLGKDGQPGWLAQPPTISGAWDLGLVERRSVTDKGLFTLRLGGGVDPVTRGDVGRVWGRLIRVAGTRELGFGLSWVIGGGWCGG